MRITSTIRRAGKSLRQAKARTLLTSLAIAVGAFTIMMSLAAGEGTRQYSENLIQSNVDPQALFIVKDKSLFNGGAETNTGLREYNESEAGLSQSGGFSADTKPLTATDIKKISARSDIESVSPIYQLDAKYLEFSVNDKKYSAEVSIYDPDIISESEAGSLPPRGDDIKDDEIVIPSGFAKTLDKKPSELIGTEVKLVITKPAKKLSEKEITKLLRESSGPQDLASKLGSEEKTVTLKVAAVLKQNPMSFANSTAAAVSMNTAKSIYDYTTKNTEQYQKFFGVTAKVAKDDDPAEVKKSLESEGYGVQTTKDLQSVIFTIVNVLQGVVAGFGVLALIASVFGIINTMYISVLERTSQIGLMKALGMRGRHVSRLFRYEAAWIGFLGGVIGIGAAYVAVLFLNPWITEKLDLGGDNRLLDFTWWQAGILLVGLIIIAIAAGYFPSRKAAKLDPIEALRTE